MKPCAHQFAQDVYGAACSLCGGRYPFAERLSVEPEFDAMAELGKLLVEGDFNLRLFGVPVAGPQARSLREAISSRIAAAVATEREACARSCESLLSTPLASPDFLAGVERCVSRVRAGRVSTAVDEVTP